MGSVPDFVSWASAICFTVSLITAMGIRVAGTFAWAGLEGLAASAGDMSGTFLVDNFLHSIEGADQVGALDTRNWDLLTILVECTIVVAWTAGLNDTFTVKHDLSSWALTTPLTVWAA